MAQPETPCNLPEAPCSLNETCCLENGRRVQITGRGQTGPEAVANFRATVAAFMAPAPPTAPTLTARDVALQLIQCAAQKDRLALVPRILKGLALAEAGAGAVTWTTDDCTHATVDSQTEIGVSYALTYTPDGGWGCNCQDWQFQEPGADGKRACKHGMAAHILRVVQA